jgi:transaldolase/glucose-6-phosphate isomerase
MNTKHSALETQSPLAQLRQYGQSIWLDFISRSLIDSGELERLVKQDGLGGVTSNPSIFHKAIEGSSDYAPEITRLSQGGKLGAREIFEQLALKDIRDAAQILAAVYQDTQAGDGYVSLEVAPDLAHDTRGTVEAARRLWRELDRPNAMIKVPGTAEGLPAVAELLGEGINVNITLLFARSTYEQVTEIYLRALEQRAARGEDLKRVASVASFFVSRIDTAVEQRISSELERRSGSERSRLVALQGKVAIANAKLAYQSYKRSFSGPRWQALKAKGARPQRVLWASTGTKNPEYRDVLYVEELIGPDTVNTMPPETLAAFRDHGRARASLESGVEEAAQVLAQLAQLGISLDRVTEELVSEGVQKFAQPYLQLLASIERRIHAAPAHG